jgi:SAM-dependent methyltransferase
MELTSPEWIETWSKIAYPTEDFRALMQTAGGSTLQFGTDDEPHSSLWLASLSRAIGDTFQEGMRVLDYGCGAGRYAHFLRQRLRNFTYIGLERRGSTVGHGESSVEIARRVFADDERIHFDFIGGAAQIEALAYSDVAVLGSIFTHVDIDEIKRIFAKLMPIVKRGGRVVFSIFLADTYRLEDPGIYGFDDCYNRSFFTGDQLNAVASHLGCRLMECERFIAQQVNVHRIFRADCSSPVSAFELGGPDALRRLRAP